MEWIKCRECERGIYGKLRNCAVGIKWDSIDCVRGCLIGEKITSSEHSQDIPDDTGKSSPQTKSET